MADITKEDIYLKARIISEGLYIKEYSEDIPSELQNLIDPIKNTDLIERKIPKKLDFSDPDKIIELFYKTNMQKSINAFLGTYLILDECNLHAPIYFNKHSRLEFDIENNKGVISDGNQVLATDRFPKKPKWLNAKLSNGFPISAALPAASDSIINIFLNLYCINYNTNQGCRYCNLCADPVSKKISMLPIHILKKYAEYQAEAVKIAINNGWRGVLPISGGALAPAQRKEYLERLELVMSAITESISDEIRSDLRFIYNHYPPEDFNDMYKWKEMGIDVTSIDLEVMDSAYFAAICPGKNNYKPHEYWKRAQEFSVKVFGPIYGTTGCVVIGIEPMSTLLKGYEERLSKGIFPIPLTFISAPGSAYWGFRAPKAEWIVEASEKMADLIIKIGLKWHGKALRFAKKSGKKISEFSKLNEPTQFSTHLSIVFDELQRRFIEMFG